PWKGGELISSSLPDVLGRELEISSPPFQGEISSPPFQGGIMGGNNAMKITANHFSNILSNFI
ncbi:hypothetical protein, partial [Scytonema sp. NUACC26]|uniref:hypothetical protein n=1 Tax=Scytonema sp. NUACC26 TaxID=3140176 RepID=UPI0038B23204